MLTSARSPSGIGLLSQASVRQPTPIEDFFITVERAYTRAEQALETGRSGFNFDVAMKEIESARSERDRASGYLKKALETGQVTEDEEFGLRTGTLFMLTELLNTVYQKIRENESSVILRYWDAFQKDVLSLVESTAGFFGERWKGFIRSYRILSDYVKSAEEFVAWMEPRASSTEAKSSLEAYKIELGNLRTQKKQMESVARSAGISQGAVDEAAAKETGLGAAPLLAKAIVTVGGIAITVGGVLKVIGAALGALTIGLIFSLSEAAAKLVGLERLIINAKKSVLEMEEAAKTELQREKDAKTLKGYANTEDAIKAQIDKTSKTSDGIAQSTPGLGGKVGETQKRIDEERKKLGIPTGEIPDWLPWVLAGAAGLLVAGFMYWKKMDKGR